MRGENIVGVVGRDGTVTALADDRGLLIFPRTTEKILQIFPHSLHRIYDESV